MQGLSFVGISMPAVEGIFTLYLFPCMGSLFVDAVSSRDYPMVMSIMLATAIVVLATNLEADLAYAVFDPRIRYDPMADSNMTMSDFQASHFEPTQVKAISSTDSTLPL